MNKALIILGRLNKDKKLKKFKLSKNGNCYIDHGKSNYDRVTKIINEVLPFYDNPAAEEKAELGTAVHSTCASLLRKLKDNEFPLWDEVEIPSSCFTAEEPYIKAFLKFRKRYKVTPLLIERVIHSERYHYAGRPDLIALVGSKQEEAVIDYSIGPIGLSKRLQTSAYKKAWRVEISKSCNKIKRLGIHLKDNGTYTVVPFDKQKSYYHDWYGFVAALQFYRWKANT